MSIYGPLEYEPTSTMAMSVCQAFDSLSLELLTVPCDHWRDRLVPIDGSTSISDIISYLAYISRYYQIAHIFNPALLEAIYEKGRDFGELEGYVILRREITITLETIESEQRFWGPPKVGSPAYNGIMRLIRSLEKAEHFIRKSARENGWLFSSR